MRMRFSKNEQCLVCRYDNMVAASCVCVYRINSHTGVATMLRTINPWVGTTKVSLSGLVSAAEMTNHLFCYVAF